MSDYISKSEMVELLYKTFEEYNMTTDKQDKHGGFGAEVFKRVKALPTVDEKEIIRKPMERILTRLEEKENEAVLKAPITSDIHNPQYQKWMMKSYGFKESIQVVREEGGIE